MRMNERIGFDSKAITWLYDNLDLFDPLRSRNVEEIINDLKSMCELLFLCSLKFEGNTNPPPNLQRDSRTFI